MELVNSKRLLYSASHVSLKLTPVEFRKFQAQPSNALKKAAVFQSLAIQRDEISTLRDAIAKHPAAAELKHALSVTNDIAQGRLSHLALAQAVAPISSDTLNTFATLAATVLEKSPNVALLVSLLEQQKYLAPVGQLYLERMEMYPVGVQRGEMVFTVPMAPYESVTISHKEWTSSSSEYEDIVQDYFESYSERGVAEKTDTSMSTENESRRSNTLNFGATLSGSYGTVSLTTNVGVTSVKDDRQSVKQSFQKNREITEKSSSRVRREHKVSMKLETKKGVEDNSFRTLTNSTNDAVRIDYYRMMRKWRTDLYRYGLRMTYDICIPTPGVRFWARWQRIAELDAQIGTAFSFSLKPSDIKDGNWKQKVEEAGAEYPAYVLPDIEDTKHDKIEYIDWDKSGIGRFGSLDFTVPDGYFLAKAAATATMFVWASGTPEFKWLGSTSTLTPSGTSGHTEVFSDLGGLVGPFAKGTLTARYLYAYLSFVDLNLFLLYQRTPEAEDKWRYAVWQAIRTAELARYQQKVAQLQEERDSLYRALTSRDTLSLRLLEREELLRLIMLWLLGPDSGYSNAYINIEASIDAVLNNEAKFVDGKVGGSGGPPTFKSTSSADWSLLLTFGDLVKFVHDAIEWENLLYFLYPYFWGSEDQGKSKLLFSHPDPEHEKFLRAGYARVVVTVRPGFEEAFTRLAETGSLDSTIQTPYVSVAENIANLARTNYTGIPPANPEKHARPLLYPQQRKTWESMQIVVNAIEDYQTLNGYYPASLSALTPGLELKDAWGNPLVYTIPGSGNDYDLISLGSDNAPGGEDTAADISAAAGASLVASWFDYTPTSGLDIEVNTKPSDIA
jgi:Type II secretion system (T2SS), protein G